MYLKLKKYCTEFQIQFLTQAPDPSIKNDENCNKSKSHQVKLRETQCRASAFEQVLKAV